MLCILWVPLIPVREWFYVRRRHNTKEAKSRQQGNLLNVLTLKTLTMDALHCQRDTLQQLTTRGADFVVQVKENQPTLLAAIHNRLQPYWEQNGDGLAQHYEQNQSHGRQEERTVFQQTADLADAQKMAWPGIRNLIAVERSRSHNEKSSLDTHYYASSLAIKPEPEQAPSALAYRKSAAFGAGCDLSKRCQPHRGSGCGRSVCPVTAHRAEHGTASSEAN